MMYFFGYNSRLTVFNTDGFEADENRISTDWKTNSVQFMCIPLSFRNQLASATLFVQLYIFKYGSYILHAKEYNKYTLY